MSTDITKIKIETIEQAKAYFIAMGCNHFHLDREDFERRDEYYNLNISKETERDWANEHISEKFKLLMEQDSHKELWCLISRFVDLVESYPSKEHLMMIYEIINKYHKTLPPKDMVIVAESIEGRRIKPSGIVVIAYEKKLYKEAKQLVIWAKDMALEAMKRDKTLEERSKSVIIKLELLMKQLKKRL